MNAYGKGAKDFTRNEIKQINNRFKNSIKPKIYIHSIIVNEKKKIGLYSYKPQTNLSVGVKIKLLKFKSKIEFTSRDKELNEKIFNEFQMEYSDLFTKEQMEEIKKSFFSGPEFFGNFL
jgi:ATP-dependent Lon protease